MQLVLGKQHSTLAFLIAFCNLELSSFMVLYDCQHKSFRLWKLQREVWCAAPVTGFRLCFHSFQCLASAKLGALGSRVKKKQVCMEIQIHGSNSFSALWGNLTRSLSTKERSVRSS